MKLLYFIVRIPLNNLVRSTEPDYLVTADLSLDAESLESIVWKSDCVDTFGLEIALFNEDDAVFVRDKITIQSPKTDRYHYHIRRAFITNENATDLGTRH